MNILYLIPARGGSKGIPGKNIKLLAGKPLIYYSIDVAREITDDNNICISSEDDNIIETVEKYGLKVPFKRPASLATDTAGSYEVITHALNYYNSKGKTYEIIVLLQPTSPFRKVIHIKEALELFNSNLDMVVSVKETKSNPYSVLYEEDNNGFLQQSKKMNITRRQDCPKVWEMNGAIYVINVSSLQKYDRFFEFRHLKKYEMDEMYSFDIDTPFDWLIAEFLLKNNFKIE